MDGRSKWEKASDEYFEKMEAIAAELDDVEALTGIVCRVERDDCDSDYNYAYERVRELHERIEAGSRVYDYGLIDSELHDIYNRIVDLYSDALLYEGIDDEDPDEEDEDFGLFD